MKRFMHATEQDKEEILALYRSLVGTEYCAWTDDYPNEETIAFDLSREALFCLKNEEDTIIGVISIDQDDAVEKLCCWSNEHQPSEELSRLGVHPAYQNQGVARLLLNYGMEELKKRGNHSVHFLVCKSNKRAIRSYDRLNFTVVGECRLFSEDWWCYEKILVRE